MLITKKSNRMKFSETKEHILINKKFNSKERTERIIAV